MAADDPGPRLREAELLIAAGRESDAVARLAVLASADAARETFTRAITALEKVRDATTLKRACEARLATVPHDARAKLALARALLRSGENEGARAQLRGLMERRAGDAGFWSAVGELFLDLKEWPEAKRAAERAIDNDPGNAKRGHEIIGVVGLLSNRGAAGSSAARTAPHPEVLRKTRQAGIFERLASTFVRSRGPSGP